MSTAPGKAYERYAWIIFFVYGLLPVMIAPIHLLSGLPPDPPSPEGMTGLTLDEIAVRIPGIIGYIRSISVQLFNFMLAMGVLVMAIAAVPYRKGEKWAWYAFWILPTNLVIQLANSRGGFRWQVDLAFIFVILIGLIIPYRKFFPRK